jgi:hypothetical protein
LISLPTYVETTELLAEFWGVIFRKYGWMHSVFLSTTPSDSLQNNISLLQDAVKKDYIYSKTTPQIKVSVGGCGRGKLPYILD